MTHRKAITEKREIDEISPTTFTLFVRTPADVEGTPADQLRLIWNGFNMDDSKTLASLHVQNGAVVLLVPRMTNQIRSIPPTTARGMLMVPGNRATPYGRGCRWWRTMSTD